MDIEIVTHEMEMYNQGENNVALVNSECIDGKNLEDLADFAAQIEEKNDTSMYFYVLFFFIFHIFSVFIYRINVFPSFTLRATASASEQGERKRKRKKKVNVDPKVREWWGEATQDWSILCPKEGEEDGELEVVSLDMLLPKRQVYKSYLHWFKINYFPALPIPALRWAREFWKQMWELVKWEKKRPRQQSEKRPRKIRFVRPSSSSSSSSFFCLNINVKML